MMEMEKIFSIFVSLSTIDFNDNFHESKNVLSGLRKTLVDLQSVNPIYGEQRGRVLQILPHLFWDQQMLTIQSQNQIEMCGQREWSSHEHFSDLSRKTQKGSFSTNLIEVKSSLRLY